MRRRGTDMRSLALDRRLWAVLLLLLLAGCFALSQLGSIPALSNNVVLTSTSQDPRAGQTGLLSIGSAAATVTGDASSLLYKDDRIYCMVPSMYNPAKLKAWGAILRSWGPSCDVIKFMVDPVTEPSGSEDGDGGETSVIIPHTFSIPESSKVAKIVVLPMVRKAGGKCSDGKVCRHIWEKMWRSWVYVAENDLSSADFFVKVDDDTYFLPSNMRKFVRENQWRRDDKHYYGHRIFMDKKGMSFISGVISAFSAGSLRAVLPVFKNMDHEYGDRSKFEHGRCVDRDGATEERTTAICFEKAGVVAQDSVDEKGRERVLPMGLPFTLMYKRRVNSVGWYWHGKPWTRGDRENCCAFDAWGFHGYKSPARLLEMHDMMTQWPLSQIDAKVQALTSSSVDQEDSEEYRHMWYMQQLRQNLINDLPYRLARGDEVSPVILSEFEKQKQQQAST